ncbi:hypothetical protein [Paludisphaera mucosa]|uniref:Uncharacterized protein n=1 Tax=Paludisphaera mucosa TaxID=3030827 RepID=A0ABT6F8D0_9BACT|nr:hypothetical protein [Paludisphaera mucosa]MDG3003625.1 hypothetical protein [Paludisphaera mucosa]
MPPGGAPRAPPPSASILATIISTGTVAIRIPPHHRRERPGRFVGDIMSTSPKKTRHAFRPTLEGVPLEARVVLSGASAPSAMAFISALRTGQVGGLAGQTTTGDITSRQLLTTYRQQMQATQAAFRQYVDSQVATLYSQENLGADGRPTKQALADFSTTVSGALNATTLGISAQTALLPGSGRRLLTNVQDSLLGSRSGSLASKIGTLVNSGRGSASQRTFQTLLDRQINSAFATTTAQITSYVRTAPLNRLAVDPATGQRVSLSQYVGGQAAQQINNTFGTLANSVGANARSALFDSTGAYNAQAATAFQQQYANALGTAAYQTNNLLAVLPNSSSLRSQLQSSFFGGGTGTGVGTGVGTGTGTGVGTGTGTGTGTGVGTGTGAGTGAGLTNTNLFNALSGSLPTGTSPGGTTTPFDAAALNTAFQTNFTTAFQNLTTPINGFLGVASTGATGGGSQLPAGFFQNGATFPGLFGSQFSGSTFNNGFNNGFATTGTGFPGFGTAPSGFNTNFGTGFNGLIGNLNQQAGITLPTIGAGTGVGTGIGTGTGTVGAGTGTIGTGTGVGTIGTGTSTGTGSGVGTIGTGTGTVGTGTGTVGTGTGSIDTGAGTIPVGTGSIDTGAGTIPVGTGTVGAGTGTIGTGTDTTGTGTIGGVGSGTVVTPGTGTGSDGLGSINTGGAGTGSIGTGSTTVGGVGTDPTGTGMGGLGTGLGLGGSGLV